MKSLVSLGICPQLCTCGAVLARRRLAISLCPEKAQIDSLSMPPYSCWLSVSCDLPGECRPRGLHLQRRQTSTAIAHSDFLSSPHSASLEMDSFSINREPRSDVSRKGFWQYLV